MSTPPDYFIQSLVIVLRIMKISGQVQTFPMLAKSHTSAINSYLYRFILIDSLRNI